MKTCSKMKCQEKRPPSPGISHPADKGMNWVRQDLRLAIYLRDGFACIYCGQGVEHGIKLTLDHIHPWSKGGCNCPKNLVTCCAMCNSSRQDKPVNEFAATVAAYIDAGISSVEILDSIKTNTDKPIKPFRAEAVALIKRRGSAAKVVAARLAALGEV